MLRLASDADVHGGIATVCTACGLKSYFMVAACGRCFVPPGFIAGRGLKLPAAASRRSRQHGPPDREVNGNIETAGGGIGGLGWGRSFRLSSPGGATPAETAERRRRQFEYCRSLRDRACHAAEISEPPPAV